MSEPISQNCLHCEQYAVQLREVDSSFEQSVITPYETNLGTVETALSDLGTEHLALMTLAWSGYVSRPDERRRNEIIAENMDQSLLALDTPGIVRRGGWLDDEELSKIRRGDFTSVASAQWQAVNKPGSVDTIVGYSLGASTAAAMVARAPDDTVLDRLVLWEPVTHQQKLSRLVARFACEGYAWSKYLKENKKWFKQDDKLDDASTPKLGLFDKDSGNRAYPEGLARGRLFIDLKSARDREVVDASTDIVLVGGTRSRVAPTDEIIKFGERLVKELGLAGTRLLFLSGESHGMIDSLPRMADVTRKIFQ